MSQNDRLPIEDALPELRAALQAAGRAVLVAPPGAGKTTRVPLALLDLVPDRIIMLEPRRLAARAAAHRLAQTLGQAPGGDVGYRMRGESVAGKRIEVVTEGILTRMLQSDPGLDGVGAVIFDEFHERSLNADLGLALTWEARAALRPALWLLVMSATLDAAPVAALLDDAPVVTSQGRSFEVTTRWLDRPAGRERLAPMPDLIERALAETDGSVLAFLPGEAEIRRLTGALRVDVPVMPLYGALPAAQQAAALTPEAGRRVVLATAIAETSLTVPGITAVVDAGLARRARVDPATGLSRLVTELASKAETTQRRGRAGRVAPGVCYRAWARAEEGAMPAFAPPEIANADLAGLALDLAQWGAVPGDLAFLTPPPEGAFAEAQALLRQLGALGADHRITAHGRRLAGFPTHPRLAHMLVTAGPDSAPIAALMGDRDPLVDAPADLSLRLDALANPSKYRAQHSHEIHRATLQRIRNEARRLARLAPKDADLDLTPGGMAALAWPDRVARKRAGDDGRYLLANGRGAVMAGHDPMSAPYIVALDLDGRGTDARIRRALALPEDELRALIPPEQVTICKWDRREGRILARRQTRIGAIVLDDHADDKPDPEAVIDAAIDALRDIGLPWRAKARRMRARMELFEAFGDLSDEALLDEPDWLRPYLVDRRTKAQITDLNLAEALQSRLSWPERERLDHEAPGHFTTPLGRKIPIDYGGDEPSISIRLQELFGTKAHPTVAGRPLRIELLSPAQRPVQITMDLPGFWADSYAEVRKDMRGRYPRHPWPEDPTQADPTLRVKRRS